ncbi:hypothetical protein LMH87_001384 [Akanthomyces muscarius]|uniref:Hydrophobin n=1 Tax=Akanthomyces muscarius TaxID=2231603 RepID=A0A9W8Q682_AKAMU|nr:hypothetical protein LMH87_001384 [Akanthomyces muscarius]KAJ4146825.1 hypothetical protein LMH87_001384 [Akanthomyces muscarius]
MCSFRLLLALPLAITGVVIVASPALREDTGLLRERDNSSGKNVCGSETSASGLKTNYYCEGDEPVCCRDSTTTLKDGIPWACIPEDGLCCVVLSGAKVQA